MRDGSEAESEGRVTPVSRLSACHTLLTAQCHETMESAIIGLNALLPIPPPMTPTAYIRFGSTKLIPIFYFHYSLAPKASSSAIFSESKRHQLIELLFSVDKNQLSSTLDYCYYVALLKEGFIQGKQRVCITI